MIKKTILSCFALLIIHVIYRDYIRPEIVISQAEWQNTQITIDKFLYNNYQYENIIVGSSIARRIEVDSLSNFFNLAFEGNAAYVGLDLIMKRNILPKRIFIEVNLLFKTQESAILVNNSIIEPIKKHIPAFRDGKQPLPMLEAILETHITPHIIPYKFNHFKAQNYENKTLDNTQQRLMKQILIQQVESMETNERKDIETQEMGINRVLSRLAPYISELENNNIQMVFFIVPSEGTYTNSSQIQKAIKEKFTPSLIHHINFPPNPSSYTTTDGWHLDKESAIKYTLYLKKEIDKLN